MRVPPLPFGASHPHQSGVRLGKCHASRKVNVCDWRGAIVARCSTTPTALRASGSGPNSPLAEKASQKSMGEFHQRPCGHPRQYDTSMPGCRSAASAMVPRIGSSSAQRRIAHRKPGLCALDRYVFCRGSCSTPAAGGGGGAVGLHRIFQRPRDADLRAHALRIGHPVTQDRNRQPGVVRLMWDEWRKRLQLHLLPAACDLRMRCAPADTRR